MTDVDPIAEWELRGNRARLVTKLTDGSYKQGRECLHDVTRDGEEVFCCLGVACDIYHEETGKGEWAEDRSFVIENGRRVRGVDFAGHGHQDDEGRVIFESYPPQEVVDYFGLTADEVKTMAQLNDGTPIRPRCSFEYIAGWVSRKDE